MRLHSKPEKTQAKPLTLAEVMQKKAQRMKETHEFFKAQQKERKLEA